MKRIYKSILKTIRDERARLQKQSCLPNIHTFAQPCDLHVHVLVAFSSKEEHHDMWVTGFDGTVEGEAWRY